MLFLILLSSCENEDFTSLKQVATGQENQLIKANYNNGRLVFTSQSDFDQTIRILKHSTERELQSAFKSFYEQGFISAFPHFVNEEGNAMKIFLQEKVKYIPKEYEDRDLELADILISSDLFASLLNVKREIIIGNTLYKYTFSGLLKTNVKNEMELEEYVNTHNLYNTLPDPRILTPGTSNLNNDITLFVSPGVNDSNYNPCGLAQPQNLSWAYPLQDNPLNPLFNNSYPCGGGGGGTQPTPPAEPNDHTEDLIRYINNMVPCNYDDAGLYGWTPFGARKVCYEYFDGNRQTKTLYSNEDWGFYEEVAVKVKHRKHHKVSAFGVKIGSYWAPKKTDEVALVINDATFKISKPHLQAPTPTFTVPNDGSDHMLFFTGGLVLNPNGTVQSYPVAANDYPTTPFDEQVIVEFFNDNISFNENMDITVKDVKNIFWNQVYDKVKDAFHNAKGTDPTKITMLLQTPDYSIVHYTNLSKRKTNAKKIKDVLDYDWGFNVSLTMNLKNNHQVITDPEQVGNPDPTVSTSFSVRPGDLTDFDAIYLDFVGVTRRGDTWKGSQMVYEAH